MCLFRFGPGMRSSPSWARGDLGPALRHTSCLCAVWAGLASTFSAETGAARPNGWAPNPGSGEASEEPSPIALQNRKWETAASTAPPALAEKITELPLALCPRRAPAATALPSTTLPEQSRPPERKRRRGCKRNR